MVESLRCFVTGVSGVPAWFSSLRQQMSMMRFSIQSSPTQFVSPLGAPDAARSHWGPESIKETLATCDIVVLVRKAKGQPHPFFRREREAAYELLSEGKLSCLIIIDAHPPSFVAQNAPASAAEAVMLQVHCLPGAVRSVLSPAALPPFLMQQWRRLQQEEEEEEESSEDEQDEAEETESDSSPAEDE